MTFFRLHVKLPPSYQELDHDATVPVNNQAEPLGQIINTVLLTSTENSRTTARLPIFVQCHGGNRVYVNSAAQGLNTGQNWADAYTSLGSADDSGPHVENCSIRNNGSSSWTLSTAPTKTCKLSIK